MTSPSPTPDSPVGRAVPLGRVGVWLPLALRSAFGSVDRTTRLAEEVERLGYGSLWSGEIPQVGRDPFALDGLLKAATRTLPTGLGVAHIEARTPASTQRAASTLVEAFDGRFVLGLGGHGTPGDVAPVTRVRRYLDAMDEAAERDAEAAGEQGRPERSRFPRVLAALGPRMLQLAAERTDGTHPFLSPVEHTADARERLGPDRLVLPAVSVMLGADRPAVRRTVLGLFGGAPGRHRGSGYHANFRRHGFSDEEIDTLADRLLDAVVAWGDEEAIVERVRAHHQAGASSVLIHPMPHPGFDVEDQLRLLAPTLLR